VFVAGATGVIGTRLVPLLVGEGHVVAGLTRSETRAGRLVEQGAYPIVLDVFDREQLTQAVRSFEPDVIVHQLTDLPDDISQIGEHSARNAKIRREGTDNLLAAARAAGSPRFLAQSVAWALGGAAGEAVAYLENAVLEYGGTVMRYGQLYGPGTFHVSEPPPPPRIHVDDAARRTLSAMGAGPGILEFTETAGRD
jgi:nucleoside-diphosphate-sugar epimerase